MRHPESLTLQEIRSRKEVRLKPLMVGFAALLWLAIVVSLVGLLYAIPVVLFVLMAHALFLASVKGNGVLLSETQLPELHARVVAASQRLGLDAAPEAYLMQSGGVLNAFATRLLSRRFIIIYSGLVEACGEDAKALDFVIGHELGHHALGHLKWLAFLAPARVVPLLGAAYSRACEYSCDVAGLAVVGELEGASRGLVVLAAGGAVAGKVSLPAFSAQASAASGFWASILELNLSHPFTTKRVRALADFIEPGTAPAPGRNPLTYPLAPILGLPAAGVAGGGAAAGLLVIVAVVGMLAAMAIPNFVKYQARARQTAAKVILRQCAQAQAAFRAEHGRFAASLQELQLTRDPSSPYSVYMGDSLLGPEVALPSPAVRGYAIPEVGFACVAAGNLDADEDVDLWFVDAKHDTPTQIYDDLENKFLQMFDAPEAAAPEAIEPAPRPAPEKAVTKPAPRRKARRKP
jgi:Zn-dependent protease with chaperone function/type II secretory pathway pseudopilin PulG